MLAHDHSKTIKIILSALSLMIGGLIYLSFRTKELVMFTWVRYLGLEHKIDKLRIALSGTHLPEFIVYCLPNALWVISYLLAADSLIDHNRHKIVWTTSLPLSAAILEGGQFVHLIPGTYDSLDLLCILTPLIIYTIYYHKTKHHYEKTN